MVFRGDYMSAVDQPLAGESLDELLERVKPRLKQVLFRYRIPVEDAEDILQEALLAAVVKWDRIRDPEAWLVVTLKNRCLIYWRRRRENVLTAVDSQVLEGLSEPESPPQDRQGARLDLATLTRDLPERHLTLLRMRYLLGHTSSEVAEELGYCPSSIRKLASRCLQRLNREANNDPPE